MIDISLKKTLKKTTIEFDDKFLNEIWHKMIKETNDKLVPPLFDEFVISIISKNKIYNDMKSCLLEEKILFSDTDEKQLNFHIDKAIKSMLGKICYDMTETYYVKYISATKFIIIYFDGLQHKKRINIEAEYKCDDGTYDVKIPYFNKNFFEDTSDNSLSNEENYENTISYILQIVKVVSHYMLTYNPTVEYKEIEASELEIKKDKQGNKFNKGYSQTIKLKSNIGKYIINSENDKKNQELIKEYQIHKKSWYVRGYYQHYGKEKVLKYIPPRINYRRNQNKKPIASKYILE